MIGLVFLIFIAVYFLVSFLVIKGAVSWAKKRGRSNWGWGLLAGFLMYNLMFWDWIPSVMMQSYYCKTEAGFWVYKSPEEWASENPEETKVLFPKSPSMTVIESGHHIDHINQRLDYEYKKTYLWPNIIRYENRLVDLKSKAVLLKEVHFTCGPCTGTESRSVFDFRSIPRCRCAIEKRKIYGGFYTVLDSYEKLGKQNDN
jgi:hypothetical protein